MHIHILGICGTFMAGLALLARSQGHRVTGSDRQVYPPMSTQLAENGIEVQSGYEAAHLDPAPDQVVVGNVMTRGVPAVEYLLDKGLPYTSGPQWLAEHILRDRWVLAVAGTHGKTTTATMLTWILHQTGLQPGYLIGGVPLDLPGSAQLGQGQHFVIEADEYDTAFFDKRAKFVHYRPRTLVLNNLEFDHADIYPDLVAIQRQFHHLVRIVPASGQLLVNGSDTNLATVLAMGCWTPTETLGDDWQATPTADGFQVHYRQQPVGQVNWQLPGWHNRSNALAAIAAAHHVGVSVADACQALGDFRGVKRRLEHRGSVAGVSVYDDFAHHPSAVAATLDSIRELGPGPLIAVLEPRSNTMRMGVFREPLVEALSLADHVVLYQDPSLDWSLAALAARHPHAEVCHAIDTTVAAVCRIASPGSRVVIMSNGGFVGIQEKLLTALTTNSTPMASDD